MEPISPELVLVDPELARWARARLPDYGNGKMPAALAEAIAGAAPARPIVGVGPVALPIPSTVSPPLLRLREAAEAAAEAEAEAEPHRVLGEKLLLVAAGLLVFLLGVLLPPILAGGDPAPSSQPRTSGDEQQAPGLPRLPTSTGSSLGSTIRTLETHPEGDRPGRVGGGVTARREAKPRRGKAASSRMSSAPATGSREGARLPKQGGAATRLFVWLPSRGARYYHVQFFRGKRIVFEAWPTEPRVALPVRGTFRGRPFAFTNGRYRWTVRPGLGPRSKPRYGEPIVRSIWIVRP